MPDDPFQQLNKHVGVSRETFERLSVYHDLLIKWQAKINLVGADTISQLWERHFLDSLQLLPLLSPEAIIVDIGSGAGFPGMALAIAGASHMHLVESDARKITFLREVARLTHTEVSIHHCRIEDYQGPSPHIIISRACAPLDRLLALAFPYVSHETICLFPKGKNYSKEIEGAKESWSFDCTVIPSVTDKEGAILKLATIKKRGEKHDDREKN